MGRVSLLVALVLAGCASAWACNEPYASDEGTPPDASGDATDATADDADGSGASFRISVEVEGAPTAVLVETLGLGPRVVATGNHVLAGGYDQPRLARIANDGTSVIASYVTLASADSGTEGARFLATDCLEVLAVSRNNVLFRAPISAGGTSTSFGSNAVPSDAYDFAVDERFFYFAAANIGGIFRSSRDGNGRESLYTGNVFRLAVDDDGVYWGEHGTTTPGNIFMLKK